MIFCESLNYVSEFIPKHPAVHMLMLLFEHFIDSKVSINQKNFENVEIFELKSMKQKK